MATFISKDKTKSYYGKEVQISESGKIEEVKQPEYEVTIGDKSMKVSAAFAEKIKGQTFYQDPVTEEVYSDPSQVPAAKAAPEITLTSKGATYTETGQTVKEARAEQLKSQAFEFLAPAEKFIAKKAGSLKTVYERVVQPKLALQRESAMLEQQMISKGAKPGELGGYSKTPVLRARQLFAEAKAGAWDMITAPIETAAILVGLKVLPSAVSSVASRFGISSGITIPATVTGTGLTTTMGIARNPQDPALGIARTSGEAAIIVTASKGVNAFDTAMKKSLINMKMTKTASSGYIDYSTTEEGIVSKQSYSEKVFIEGKDTYKVSSVAKSRLYPEGEAHYGKGDITFEIAKGGKIIKGTGTSMETYKPLEYNRDIQLGMGEYEFTIPDTATGKNIFVKKGDISFSRQVNPGGESTDIVYLRGVKDLGYATGSKQPFFKTDLSGGKITEVIGGQSVELYKQSLITESGSDVGYTRYINIEGGLKGTQENLAKAFMPKLITPAQVTQGVSTVTGTSVSSGTTLISTAQLQSVQASTVTGTIEKSIRLSSIKTGSTLALPSLLSTPSPQVSVQLKQSVGLESIQKVTPIIRQSQSSSLNVISISRQKQIPAQRQSIIPSSRQIVTPSLRQSIIPSLDVDLKPALAQSQTTTSTGGTPITDSVFNVTPPEMSIRGIGMPLQYYSKSPAKKVKFKPKYFASIEATAFGIKGKMPSKRELMTGLNIRPLQS